MARPPTGPRTIRMGLSASNYNSLGVLDPTGTPLYPSGPNNNVALIFLWPQTVPQENLPAGIQQTLSATLAANTEYILSVRVGNIAVGGAAPFDLNGFPGYQVQLLAGGVVLAQDNNTLNPAEGQFLLSTVEFTTDANPAQLNQPLSIRLINLGAANSGIEVNYDDVELEANAVPEPASAVLVLMGALLLRRRRG